MVKIPRAPHTHGSEKSVNNDYSPDTSGDTSFSAADIPPEFFDTVIDNSDISAMDAGQSEPIESTPKRGRPPKTDKRVMQVATLYGRVGAAFIMFGQVADGQVILACAMDRAEEVVAVAKSYPKALAVIDAITKDNAWITLLFGHGALAMALAKNHGIEIDLAKIVRDTFSGVKQRQAQMQEMQRGSPQNRVYSPTPTPNPANQNGVVGNSTSGDIPASDFNGNPAALGLEQRR